MKKICLYSELSFFLFFVETCLDTLQILLNEWQVVKYTSNSLYLPTAISFKGIIQAT